jgi:hypothetical protein
VLDWCATRIISNTCLDSRVPSSECTGPSLAEAGSTTERELVVTVWINLAVLPIRRRFAYRVLSVRRHELLQEGNMAEARLRARAAVCGRRHSDRGRGLPEGTLRSALYQIKNNGARRAFSSCHRHRASRCPTELEMCGERASFRMSVSTLRAAARRHRPQHLFEWLRDRSR